MCVVFRQCTQEWVVLKKFYEKAMKNVEQKEEHREFMKILNDQIKLHKEIKDYLASTPLSQERTDRVMAMIKDLKQMFRQRSKIRRQIFPKITFPKGFYYK